MPNAMVSEEGQINLPAARAGPHPLAPEPQPRGDQMLQFAVDRDLCTQCDLCVSDCPVRIIERPENGYPRIVEDEADDCMACQHCLAICPPGAVSILGRDPEGSQPLAEDALPTLDAMELLVRGRRSVRQYRAGNVDPVLLERLLRATANAPTGVNRQGLTFHVIDDHESMERFRRKAMAEVRDALSAGEVPEQLQAVGRFVEAYFEEDRDLVFRGAPHALVVSAPPDAPCPQEDVVLALAYFELLAQSAGVGTVWCGLMKMVLEAKPSLKEELGLPADHAYYCMLFGNPAIEYARTVQRDDGAAIGHVRL